MKKLKAYMRKNKLRLEPVAAAVGVSVPTIHSWVAGRAKPSIVNAINLESYTMGFVSVYDWAK